MTALRLPRRHEVMAPGADAAVQAMALSAAHKRCTCNALIVHAASGAGCATLFSEDLQACRRLGALARWQW